jgi:hypothetical protein
VNTYLERLKAISGKPPVCELPKLSKGDAKLTSAPVCELPKLSKGAFGTFDSARTTRIRKIAPPADPRLADLLREHGGYPSVRWDELALTDAQESALWIVQRPDGLLTTLATVEPIPKPKSYTAAWPARFTSPEPTADAVPAAAEAAAQAVQRARQSCWGCAHLSTRGGPGCAKGHPVCWRQFLTRTYPSRSDKLDCADQDGRES